MSQIAEHARTDVDLGSAPLRDVENYLGPRLRAFVEAGLALMAIRERRLYIQAGWDTFELYCKDRWQIDASHARRMCDAAQVAAITGSTDAPVGAGVENEAQARELAPLLGRPDELRAVWQKTVEQTERTGQPVTAAAIRQVRREHEARHAPPRPDATPHPRPPARPAQPVTVIPADAQRVFLLLTQAAQEAEAVGGASAFQGRGIPRDVLTSWARGLEDTAAYCAALAEACRDQLA